MSVDILNMTQYEANNQAIDVALPVLAIECEATPPLENYLDAYEEAVLKLVSLGLSTNGISKTLNAAESLIDEILALLEIKNYAKREIGMPWKLTEDGEKYLDGTIKERASSESQYGFMFINAIKKEILPYFYEGDIGRVSLFRGEKLPLKLTSKGDEYLTFAPVTPKQSKLRKAYKAYFRNNKLIKNYDEGDVTKDEATELFSDLDSFDEEIEDEAEALPREQKKDSGLKENMFIRALNKKPIWLYLRMRIIIDPSYPGGYRAESPFDYGGIDNNYFLRQIQWLEQSDTAFLDGEPLKDFLNNEICKIAPAYKASEKDFHVFLTERMPLLKLYRSRVPYVYEDMERIYALIQRQSSLLEKENIVNNLARSVVEGLFNTYFKAIGHSKLDLIKQRALDEVDTYGRSAYEKRICQNVHLRDDTLSWINHNYLRTVITRLGHTYGNSIMEKFINMLIVEYHMSDARMHRFLFQPNIGQKYQLIDKLNGIRKKVSHDTDDRFITKDYEYYMANVYDLINSLLEAYRED